MIARREIKLLFAVTRRLTRAERLHPAGDQLGICKARSRNKTLDKQEQIQLVAGLRALGHTASLKNSESNGVDLFTPVGGGVCLFFFVEGENYTEVSQDSPLQSRHQYVRRTAEKRPKI